MQTNESNARPAYFTDKFSATLTQGLSKYKTKKALAAINSVQGVKKAYQLLKEAMPNYVYIDLTEGAVLEDVMEAVGRISSVDGISKLPLRRAFRRPGA